MAVKTMRTSTQKDVLTTGQVAKICHVAPRTVSKWFDSGKLRGYRIPGSRDRRIPKTQLVAFMRAHGMPMEELEGASRRVLIVDSEVPEDLVEKMAASGHCEVRTTANGFEAGMLAQQFRPTAVLVDINTAGDEIRSICGNIKKSPQLAATKLIATGSGLDVREIDRLVDMGFDDYLAKPYSLEQLSCVVEDAANLIF